MPKHTLISLTAEVRGLSMLIPLLAVSVGWAVLGYALAARRVAQNRVLAGS